MLQEETKQNRKRFISALETNAAGYIQLTGSLVNRAEGGVCAVGMGMDEFGIERSHPDVYGKMAEILGLKSSGEDPEGIRYIYFLNDTLGYSFKQIAAKLRERWKL